MQAMPITRKVEFDAGHRIPDHKSKCRSPHGHRYVMEATVLGRVQDLPGDSDNGMVIDFGDLKAIMVDRIAEPWDHAFLVSVNDIPMIGALKDLEGLKMVTLPFIPTVENLVAYAFDQLDPHLLSSNMELVRVRLYETPNCWADAYGRSWKHLGSV